MRIQPNVKKGLMHAYKNPRLLKTSKISAEKNQPLHHYVKHEKP